MRARGKGRADPTEKSPCSRAPPALLPPGVPQPPQRDSDTRPLSQTLARPCLSQGPAPCLWAREGHDPRAITSPKPNKARARSLPAFQPCHPLSSLIIKRPSRAEGLSQLPKAPPQFAVSPQGSRLLRVRQSLGFCGFNVAPTEAPLPPTPSPGPERVP